MYVIVVSEVRRVVVGMPFCVWSLLSVRRMLVCYMLQVSTFIIGRNRGSISIKGYRIQNTEMTSNTKPNETSPLSDVKDIFAVLSTNSQYYYQLNVHRNLSCNVSYPATTTYNYDPCTVLRQSLRLTVFGISVAAAMIYERDGCGWDLGFFSLLPGVVIDRVEGMGL